MSQPPKAVGAGRGLLFISGAKVWFMVTGYVIQFGLPRALEPAQFGLWVLVLALVSPINNVIVTANIQSVARFVAERDDRAGQVARAALALQVWVAGGLALGFFLAAPWLAALLGDETLTPLLRVASGIILCYGFYSVFVGIANGERSFHKQAGLDAMFSTMRAGFVVGGALVLHTVVGSLAGFVTAAAIILVVSIAWVGWPRAQAEKFSAAVLGRFFASISVYLLLLNLLMFVDSIVLKALMERSHSVADINVQIGIYGASQALARIPYQLILVATFVVFPLVSRSTFSQDTEKTRLYVQTTLRYSLVVTALLGCALGSKSEGLLRVLYSKQQYAGGAPALSRLIVGYVAFSLFAVGGSILNSAGRVIANWILCGVSLLVAVIGTVLSVQTALASGGEPLVAASSATAAAMILGAIGTLVTLHRAFGASIPLLTWLRVAGCALAALAIGHFWPTTGALGGKVGALVCTATSATVFLLVAIATGELRPREILALRRATKN